MTALSRKLAVEFVATLMFIFVGAGSAIGAEAAGVKDPGSLLIIAALGNGVMLAVAVSASMGISGGVLNPAIALGLWVGKKIPAREVLPYIVVELAGAVAGGLLLVASVPSGIGSAVGWGAPSLNSMLSVASGILIEAVLTFILVLSVYLTAVDQRAPKVGGLAIGLTVLVEVLFAGPLTGAAMNPARAMGPMIASWSVPAYWYVYWVGPVIGSVVGSAFYRFLEEKSQ